VKASQERVVEQGPVLWSLVRATQFHEYIGALFAAAARWHVLRAPLQTASVSCAEVARVAADVAEGAPRRGRVTIAGPEVVQARALARRWRAASGRPALLVPVPLPGRIGRALRSGTFTTGRPDVRGDPVRAGSPDARGRHRRSSQPLTRKENKQSGQH
jgi:uncharacterized protein YbjT (DUF2867 family)